MSISEHVESGVYLPQHRRFKVVILTFVINKEEEFNQCLNQETILVNEVGDLDERLGETFFECFLKLKPYYKVKLNSN
jgi:hypothetical protein